MIAPRREPRGPDCPSDLGLSQLMVGETGVDGRQSALRTHVESCARCRARLDQFQSGPLPPLRPSATQAAAETPAVAPRAPSPRRWQRRVAAAAGFAAAAAALVIFVRRGEDPAAPDSGVRAKGELALGVIVRRASGATDRLASGASVAPGDVLRFELGHPGPGHAAVVGIDSRRVVSVYVPQDAALPFIAGAGSTQLPGAIALDDAPGSERLFALLCDEPLPLERIRREAAARLSSASQPDDVRTLGLPCRESSFLLTKVARR